jgi:rhodanese-related sulfurtransferase
MQIKKNFFALMAAASFIVAGQSVAAESPATIPGATMVTAEQAKQAIDKGAPVFDLRTPTEFAEGSVKGSVSIPYKEKSTKVLDFDAAQDSFDLSKLPADRAAPVVFYCAGVECWKSFKGATVAVKAGFKKVMVMRGGWPEWKGKGYPIQ